MNQQTAVILAAAIAAAIAAIATLFVTLYNNKRQSKLEYEKWIRTREDQIDKEFRSAIAELSRKIVVGSHRIIWLAWKAKNDPTGLKEEDFLTYDKNMGDVFPDIVGARVLVSAFNRQAHNEITPFVRVLYDLDEKVAHATKSFKDSPKASIEALEKLYDETVKFDSKFLEMITDITGLNRN